MVLKLWSTNFAPRALYAFTFIITFMAPPPVTKNFIQNVSQSWLTFHKAGIINIT